MQRSMCRIQKNHNNKFTVFYTNKRLVIKMKKSLETVLTGEINKENKFLNLEQTWYQEEARLEIM